MPEKTWKLSDPEAKQVIERNVRQIDQIFEGLWKKCGNPYCNYPISSLPTRTYGAPEYGDVCATCHDLYTALSYSNVQLSNSQYFLNAHNDWKRDGGGTPKKRPEW